MPAALNVRDAQQARLALHPWKDIATETDAAIWLLGHSNRLSTGSVRDRYGATYVLRQKARMTIWAMQDERRHPARRSGESQRRRDHRREPLHHQTDSVL